MIQEFFLIFNYFSSNIKKLYLNNSNLISIILVLYLFLPKSIKAVTIKNLQYFYQLYIYYQNCIILYFL